MGNDMVISRANLFGKSQVLKGDLTSHGGVVTSGSATSTWHGIAIARKGDDVFCPRCKPHFFKIDDGLPNVTDAGLPMAVEGHRTTCGAVLIARTAPASVLAAANSLLNADHSSYNEQLQVVGDSGKPLANIAYFIEGDHGTVFYGDTDADGKCPRLATDGEKPLKYWFGISAIQKMNEALK